MKKTLPMNDDRLAEVCKALGHPARIRILRFLIAEDRCICGRIVEVMPLAQSTVSQHLKVLKAAGLVQGEIEGPKTCYCVNKDMLASLGMSMSELTAQDSKRNDILKNSVVITENEDDSLILWCD